MEDKVIITLTDEQNQTIDYELLDIVPFEGQTYAVFYPTSEGDTEVVICSVKDMPNSDNSIYETETNPRVLNEVYALFKKKNRGNIYFADGKE